MAAIQRKNTEWGMYLTAAPFTGGPNGALVIKAEIARHKPGKGSEVRITFPGTALGEPLRLLDAQTWCAALTAVITETRTVVAKMKDQATRAQVKPARRVVKKR